jgi:hypothetical protein
MIREFQSAGTRIAARVARNEQHRRFVEAQADQVEELHGLLHLILASLVFVLENTPSLHGKHKICCIQRNRVRGLASIEMSGNRFCMCNEETYHCPVRDKTNQSILRKKTQADYDSVPQGF